MADAREFEKVGMTQGFSDQLTIFRRCNRVKFATQYQRRDIAYQWLFYPRIGFLNRPVFADTKAAVFNNIFNVGCTCQLFGQCCSDGQKFLRRHANEVLGAEHGIHHPSASGIKHRQSNAAQAHDKFIISVICFVDRLRQ